MSEKALAIEVRDLKKSYSDDVQALDGISFDVPAGTVFGLLGPNGAGKSTTIKILTTLTRPDAGTAKITGVDVVARPGKVRHAIGCVAQQSGVDPAATGRENLLLQGRLYGLRGNALKSRVDELLDRFDLVKPAGQLAKTYSGGMRRKLDVAMGLVHRPKVLFLDEPTTGLDPEARSELWQEIVKLAGEGVTVILTTHYLEEADELARDLVILDQGRIVAQGSPAQLKNELHGDAIQVELAEAFPPDAVQAALADLEGVRDVVTSERRVSARVDHGASAAPAVLSSLETAGLRVVSVTLSAPTLDDVYLRHAGRTFRSAHEEASR
ncbi:ATP-binding cassette domain-containing protein [Actinoallomurus sp. NPDC052274]|uniref:ATP-binding cassette domain-containing protein n=1 Tax=Actinoallomurus sp. NPDC052274 TaxID=3155420 RepID=UPI00342F095A